MPRALNPLTELVFKMASTSDGVSTSEVPGYTVRQVGRAVEHLIERKRIHRGRASSKVVRFFANKEDAESFHDAALLYRGGVAIESTEKAPWPADAPINYPKDASGNDAFKFTRCPPSAMGLTRTNTHEDW